eukprot:CAMPEP_0179174594 /NCGR_PEP_ID=MMETSP0796-20121207/86202_1 /TAXON_ID=73915 /ORGANISM="Pyrodinium bahamense, Strain pbaha01" /LENGTH=287 /DNA_ID=CAMNT_0020877893 /DNA_START=170 /DNA_END=1032 /DNA_ORIENTATION=-
MIRNMSRGASPPSAALSDLRMPGGAGGWSAPGDWGGRQHPPLLADQLLSGPVFVHFHGNGETAQGCAGPLSVWPQLYAEAGPGAWSGIAHLDQWCARGKEDEAPADPAARADAVAKWFDSSARLRAYQGPLLILHTQSDRVVPVSSAEEFASMAEDGKAGRAKLIVWPSGGHNQLHFANYDALEAALRDFVAGQTREGETGGLRSAQLSWGRDEAAPRRVRAATTPRVQGSRAGGSGGRRCFRAYRVPGPAAPEVDVVAARLRAPPARGRASSSAAQTLDGSVQSLP